MEYNLYTYGPRKSVFYSPVTRAFIINPTFSSSTISMICFLKYLTKMSDETWAAFYRNKIVWCKYTLYVNNLHTSSCLYMYLHLQVLCWAKTKLSNETKSRDTCRVLQYKSWPSGLPLGSWADTHIKVCHWKRITL